MALRLLRIITWKISIALHTHNATLCAATPCSSGSEELLSPRLHRRGFDQLRGSVAIHPSPPKSGIYIYSRSLSFFLIFSEIVQFLFFDGMNKAYCLWIGFLCVKCDGFYGFLSNIGKREKRVNAVYLM